MITQKAGRYDLANLPISEVTRKGLTKDNINQIGAIGRMLSLQDDVYDEQFDKLCKLIEDQTKSFNLRFDAIDSRLTLIEDRMLKMETGATEREIRLSILEKHNSLPQSVIRYGIIIVIGMLLGWTLHSFV